jgi:DNA-binding CsgD family transcriptional regulator/sugar-specific transcriptional regulator TrmB
MLEVFGVTDQAEAVYLALVSSAAASVADLANIAGVSCEAVRAALDELARLSLVHSTREDQEVIGAVSPQVGLEYLLAKEQAELLERQVQIEHSRAEVTALIADLAERRPPSPSDPSVTTVDGIDAIRLKLEQLAYAASSEVLSFMPDGAQTPDNIAASQSIDQMLLRRGVQVRSVCLDSIRNDPPSRRYVQLLIDQGEEIRLTAVLPMRMVIFDRQTAVVPSDPGRSEIGAVIVQGVGPVDAMCALFSSIWERAVPYGGVSADPDESQLTSQQRTVVRLLAEGDTDSVISRKLGISPRTVGRLVSEVMAVLDAKSRFQAGVRAAEFGWHRVTPGSPEFHVAENGIADSCQLL